MKDAILISLIAVIIFLVLLSITFIIIFVLKSKKNNSKDKNTDNNLFNYLIENLKLANSENNEKFKSDLLEQLNEKFNRNNNEIREEINKNNNKSNETLKELTENIALFKKFQEESKVGIDDLRSVLSNQKNRGSLGEITLESILESTFGTNEKLYKRQYQLKNDKIVDAVIFAPQPINLICIDSKFPLENYSRYIKAENKNEKEEFKKIFKQDLKKHIDTIKDKYIINGVTFEKAFMFIPSEAIFNFVINECSDYSIDYANKAQVFITGPSTLIFSLSSVGLAAYKINEYRKIKPILSKLEKIKIEFLRFKERQEAIVKDFDKLHEDFNKANITHNKITKQFDETFALESKVIPEIEYRNDGDEINDSL